MDRKALEKRTRQFHIDVIRLCERLPKNAAGFETARQLIRAAGSVGSNYRASRRAKSTADFQYKLCVVLEEADESAYWLGVIAEVPLIPPCPELDALIQEAMELTLIFSASERTVKQQRAGSK